MNMSKMMWEKFGKDPGEGILVSIGFLDNSMTPFYLPAASFFNSAWKKMIEETLLK